MEAKELTLARANDAGAVSMTPPQTLALAIEKGVDPGVLGKMLELQERWEAGQARKAFVRAMSDFKREVPAVLKKDATVDFSTSRGHTHYRHATLGGIVDQITPQLSAHGLSVSWACEQHNGGVTVACHVTHAQGHSESVTLTAPPDDSGNKNKIQQVGSTVTYLQRYTLLAVLGLATADQDDDGVAAGMRPGTGDAPMAETDVPDDIDGGAVAGPTPAIVPASGPARVSHAAPPAPLLCPECGADAVDQRGQTSKGGKKLPAFKCSAGRYNRETKKAEGCTWVSWDTEFFSKPPTADAPDARPPSREGGVPPITQQQIDGITSMVKGMKIPKGEVLDMLHNMFGKDGVTKLTGAEADALSDHLVKMARARITGTDAPPDDVPF